MNYNQSSFRIDKKDFLRGNNSYEDYPDGGVVTSVIGLNTWSKPGKLANAPRLNETVTPSLPADGVISWGVGKGTISLDAMAVMTDTFSGDGSFFTVGDSTGSLTKVGATDTSQDYAIGWVDTVFYQGNFYTTSRTDIIKNNPDLTTRDLSYWVTTKGESALTTASPHPMVVFGDILYIANTNVLHQIDGATVTTSVLDLGSDYVITALAVYNNMIYITAEPYWNAFGNNHNGAKIFTWNGYSPSWIDEWDVDYRINSMYVAPSGVMYIFNNHYMGYWTGNRIQYLRPVNNQIFKCHITSTTNSLMYADGDTIVRYGTPLFGGTKRFFSYFFSDSHEFVGITSLYNNSITISQTGTVYSTNHFLADVDTPEATRSHTFTFNKRRFSRPVKVRGVVIDTEQLVSGHSYVIKYYDEKNNLKVIGTFAATDATMLNKYTWGFPVVGDQNATRSIQPVLVQTGGGHLEGIDILYGPAESKFNQ